MIKKNQRQLKKKDQWLIKKIRLANIMKIYPLNILKRSQ